MKSDSVSMPEGLARVLSEIDARPIQTRGPFPTRSERTRGRVLTLSDLIAELRKDAIGSALIFVIHDWDMQQVVEFFREDLTPLLDDRDGVWLVPSQRRRRQSRGKPASGVELDLGDKTDKRLYKTLVGDIVFFAGLETNVDQLEAWQRRARVVVLDEGGHYFSEMFIQARALRMVTYQRSRNGTLVEL